MKKIQFLFSFLLIAGYALASGTLTVTNLRCEYMRDPLGIDIRRPRLSYELLSGGKNRKQSARQILVASSPALLKPGKADVWDSGKTSGSETNQIELPGEQFSPFTYYFWKVGVWDERGAGPDWSNVARFSTGALSASDWKAQWIGEDEAVMTSVTKYYSSEGYACDAAIQPFAHKWITIDLGRQAEVDELRLYPLAGKPRLFPLHFKVELSAHASFAEAVILAGEINDTTDVNALPYIRKLPHPQTGRYLRLTVTKLPYMNKGVYEYGLSEIELISRGQNVALHCPVKASDSKIEYRWGDGNGPWHPELLTDGRFKPDGGGYFKHTPPSPLLRKEITIGKKIRSALYHTSALGLYEASINGQKVGRQHLAPEWTDYDHHVQYQTHDVTALLHPGRNALGAILADGWYAGARWSHPGRGGYGGFARKFIAQLVINYEDGTTETVATDSSWRFFPQSPIVAATFFGGEEYNANYEQPGWNKAGFDDSQWTNVPVASPLLSLPARASGQYILRAQMNEPVSVIREIKPISVRKAGGNKYIFDMGQNMVGWCRLSLPYNPGRDIRFRYAEVLNDDGSLYTDNMRDARPIDLYHPSSGKTVEYEPRFTYHGFRYVEVEGLSQSPSVNSIVGKFVASSSPVVGSFETSDKDVNKLWENIRWTQWGNLISVPTDCPQRDEREGWMGDAQVFAQTAIYNLDMAGFYTKWMRDIRDDQLSDGRLPDISPNDGMWEGFYNAPGWADAGVIIPWRVYQNYNDTALLVQQYDCMKRFIDFIHRHNPDLLWRFRRGHMYGDWLNGDAIIAEDYPKSGGGVDNDIFATAYFAYSTSILAKAAGTLSRTADHEYYSSLAENIRNAFVKAYVSTADGTVKGDTQAGYAIALEFGLIPENLRAQAAAKMADALKPYDGRMSTGIHTTIRLMNQLSEYGYNEQAFQLLFSRRFPSWLYSINQGATTIWERWDGYVAGRGFQDAGMNSFNHVAIGAVGEWMYNNILGIRYDENCPGYRHFIIKPQPDKRLAWAKGSYHSINGLIEVSWTNVNGLFSLNVTIPTNTESTICLPDGTIHKSGSGKHSFSVRIR
ncbi:MAG: family 78 glycoside hydrolase catalytic domain [Tannerellaceae bacterium]|jgi:alpha-L-rhamnosidase|nr:family 78 glycoside hydrolase catalytic domain [Tannerellaceae bacterium]